MADDKERIRELEEEVATLRKSLLRTLEDVELARRERDELQQKLDQKSPGIDARG